MTPEKSKLAKHKKTFSALKALLSPYERNLFVVDGKPGRYCLASMKDVVVAGRPKSELWFAGIMVQSSYVGFYFMPMYTTAGVKSQIDPELRKLLKGKSCFHVKEVTPSLKRHIKNALKLGFAAYKKNGWV
jgi:hypothetical protein